MNLLYIKLIYLTKKYIFVKIINHLKSKKMKTKIKFITLLAVLSAMLFTGCKKEENSYYPLDGTTWFETETIKVGSSIYTEENTVVFSTSTVQITIVEKQTINGKTNTTTINHTGTYVYDHPNVIIKANGETNTGLINDNKLTIGDYTLTKK